MARASMPHRGAGYGGKSRPDWSNTAFIIDALKSCGAGADDPDIQRARELLAGSVPEAACFAVTGSLGD